MVTFRNRLTYQVRHRRCVGCGLSNADERTVSRTVSLNGGDVQPHMEQFSEADREQATATFSRWERSQTFRGRASLDSIRSRGGVMERLLRQSDIIKLFIETAPIPMSEEQKEAFESGLVDMLKDIPAVEPKVDKDYLIELIQGAVYDGEDCARLMKMVESKQGEWIPCSERMPEYRKLVDVTTRDLRVKLAYLDSIKEDGTDDLWIMPLDDAECALWNIVAWMPLPEPWEGADDAS